MLYGIINNGYTYYYVRDILGNILGLVDINGSYVIKYTYNAFGKVLEVEGSLQETLGKDNPFIYKGYYYDNETGLYYNVTRYYDPQWGRFLNADDVSYLDPQSINGLNLFAYCYNNPVMYSDPSGNIAIPALFAITIAAAFIGGAAQLISNAMAGKTGSELWRGVAGAAIGAGVNALMVGLTLATGGASIFLAAGVGAIMQTGTDTIETLIRGETIDWGATAVDLGVNFASTAIGNFIGGKMVPTNRGWFQPQKFISVFTKSYGQKILFQTVIGAGISGAVNFARKYDCNEFKPIIIGPVVPIWR